MKNFYTFILICSASLFFAQSKITVKSSGDNLPLSNAVVSCNKKILGRTNTAGVLVFRSNCNKVEVKAPGYLEDEAVVDKVMEITLAKNDPDVKSIEGVVLQDKSDPRALAILQKVNDNYKDNSPKSLDSYAFKSYEKFSYDFDEDSLKSYNRYISNRIDSLKGLPEQAMKTEEKKDSLDELNMLKLMKQSKLFLWERAQEYLYSQKFGEKINVLDNRVSGLKDPIYELMTVRSNRTKMPREIQIENRDLYRFFLTDTIEIEGRQNFVIRFRQVDYKQPVQRRRFNGYLYVDAETYALKKLESNSKIKSEGTITSIWKPIDNKWFLLREDLKLRMGSTVFDEKKTDDKKDKTKKKRFGNYVYMSTDYFDFKTPIEVKAKDFSGYTMSVQNTDGTLLDQYRTDTLSVRERNTYTQIDSLGKKYNIDQRAGVITNLIKGKIRVGMVDFDASRILGYNQYEGLRLGIGAKLNEKFNRYISPDAYIAYGFKDGDWKYGAGLDVKTTLEKTSFFRAEFFHDVKAAGRFSENLWNFRMKLMNSGIDLKNDRFYSFEGFKVSYENDLTNALTMNISAKHQKESAVFDYNFMNLGNDFQNSSALLTFKYSPNSKNIMTPSGKYTYEQNYPEVYLNYEQSVKTLGGDFSFSRIDALFLHSFRTKIGVTGVRLYGGISVGDAPIWHKFSMNGLSSGKDGLNFNLASYIGFATMEGGKYYNDKFFGYYFTHRIPWYFKSFGKNTSSFDVIYRGITGDMKNPEYHQMDFQKLDHLYQEVGLEWNNFLSSQFNLGLFYRVGYYSTPNFKQNFAIQLKLKALGF
ncbi:DUF5686 family protein [Chryseobacterium sp.]|uniref:DUF5686 family protein n=1 Tax=Chryseobacterium sp. TaxID=1871047 RepID=UPI0011C9A474|nr:hypothetical protein [Chryseobacterium sp.]TXF77613.1 hypothetical protein FUA25_06705 [Chryseobacterium sp.]